eukprot:COSAG02_NODE_969_length_15565_cov_9.614833_14_plen_45_part_00
MSVGGQRLGFLGKVTALPPRVHTFTTCEFSQVILDKKTHVTTNR